MTEAVVDGWISFSTKASLEQSECWKPTVCMRRGGELAKWTSSYRVTGKIGEGGFAEVKKAKRLSDGTVLALKIAFAREIDRLRMRREIEVQSRLDHPNIMPILDFDPDMRWFIMPLAEGDLLKLRSELTERDLVAIIFDIAEALHFAHQSEYVHRDVTPKNVLAVRKVEGQSGDRRWLVADWGMVRQPESEVSQQLTKSQHVMGTIGYIAPETFVHGHEATPSSDVYSLGRVAAWFLTGQTPYYNVELYPKGDMIHWRAFVRACTDLHPERRPQDMKAVQKLLQGVLAGSAVSPVDQIRRLVDDAILNDRSDIDEIFDIVEANTGNAILYVDHVARLPDELVTNWTRDNQAEAASTARRLLYHLDTMDWNGRGDDYVTTPLGFAHAVLRALIMCDLGLAEDVGEDFFRQERRVDHWKQRIRTQNWLTVLPEPQGAAMARAMRAADAVEYHQQPATWQAQSRTLWYLLTDAGRK